MKQGTEQRGMLSLMKTVEVERAMHLKVNSFI